jgi:hypothetical protein
MRRGPYAAQHASSRGRELLPQDSETRALVAHWIDCASMVGDALQGLDRRAGHCIRR